MRKHSIEDKGMAFGHISSPVADMLGRLEQAADYYPYGELWRPPSGSAANAFLFEGKERLTAYLSKSKLNKLISSIIYHLD